MQSLFAALYELIKEPLRPDRGVKTDSSILLIYPPDKELDFREYLLDSFIPHLQAKKLPFTHLDQLDSCSAILTKLSSRISRRMSSMTTGGCSKGSRSALRPRLGSGWRS